MAVVQISKIQHRRGRSSAGTGLPQLASGELGWAIDTQKLYIGNGSVSEGAPYVGNTEILTEHTPLLDLIEQYQYKRNDPSIQTGPTAAQPIRRSVQNRLDDVISVRSFGALANGSADDTLAIQRAIDQLYINQATVGSPSSRIVLSFEAGVYKISQPLRIPPYAVLKGAGKDKTIIRQTGEFPVAYTINSSSTPGNYKDFTDLTSLNQAQYIDIEGMTFEHTVAGYPILDLISVKNSRFSNLKLKGVWNYAPGTPLTVIEIFNVGPSKRLRTLEDHGLQVGDEIFARDQENGLIAHRSYFVVAVYDSTTFSLSDTPEGLEVTSFVNGADLDILVEKLSNNEVGVRLIALSSSVSCSDNLFFDCDFSNLSYAVDSTYDIDCNTFSNCYFYECSRGVRFGHNVNGTTTGRLYGPQRNRIVQSKFERIKETGFEVIIGTGNLSENNKYIDVGNDGGGESTPVYNVINFVSTGNVSASDFFQRSVRLTSDPALLVGVPYVGEVAGSIKTEHKFNQKIELREGINPLMHLPADDSLSHVVHYFYRSDAQSVTRQGTLFVNFDKVNNTVHLTDDCSSIGNTDNVEKLSFSALLGDADTDAVNETIIIQYTNNVSSDNGYINYWYETLS